MQGQLNSSRPKCSDKVTINQNNQWNWWYAQALEGHNTGAAPQEVLKNLPTPLLLQAAAKGVFSYAFLFLLPVNRSVYSLIDI